MNRFAFLPAIVLLLVVLIAPLSAIAAEPEFVVAGYLPNYKIQSWTGELGPVTDLLYFGTSVGQEARFDTSRIPPAHLKRLQETKEATGCRLLLTIGGWDKSSGFAKLVADDKLRKKFVADAADYCKAYGFGGIDYDWEHPEGKAEVDGFTTLIQETADIFHRQEMIVTIAQAGWQQFSPQLYESLDRVHLMSYDHAFPQATMEKAESDINKLRKAGCPAARIVLGIPFYGRNEARKAKTYAQLLPAGAAHNSLVEGYALNSPDRVFRKVRYAQQEKLVGIMIWEIAQDTNGPDSLLKAIQTALTVE